MSDIKELNNEELNEISGGTNNHLYEKFQVGDWFEQNRDSLDMSAYYVKEVLNDQYYLIKYTYSNFKNMFKSEYTVTDIGYQQIDQYNSFTYRKIYKPDWIKD